MNINTVLVFPINMDASEDFIGHVKSLGIRVIGASSVNILEKIDIDNLFNLPFVTDDLFAEKLHTLIKEEEITHLHSSHTGVWTTFQTLIQHDERFQNIILCQPFPFEENWLKIKKSLAWGESVLTDDYIKTLPADLQNSPATELKPAELAGLHGQYTSILGHCDEEKLAAMVHILANTPCGDIVEIGSLFGRSAFALGWLANRFNIGSTICVDPWDMKKIKDQGKKADILNKGNDQVDFEKIFNSFLVNISLLERISYIKETSVEAEAVYKQAAVSKYLDQKDVYRVPIEGKIALLHIDGNHEFRQVLQDVETWVPYVKSGGWVLLDDYEWAFGDGPREVGNMLLNSWQYDFHFVVSDTLVLKKA